MVMDVGINLRTFVGIEVGVEDTLDTHRSGLLRNPMICATASKDDC